MNPNKLAPASEICKHVRNAGERGHVHENTIRCWMREGIQLSDGRRLFLQRERVGGRLLTTLKWVKDFNAALDGMEALQGSAA